MKAILTIVLSVSTCFVFGQQFKGEATVPPVEVDGFYRILISPELSKYLNTDFSNIRILDDHQQEVPYILQEEKLKYFTQQFKSYSILEKKLTKNCCTSLILSNPNNQSINNIILSIKNAEVTKHATLLGSDNQQDWFVLKQHFLIHTINNQNNTYEIKIVDFPLSNYTYYQLQLDDSTSAPLNIINAGYFEVNTETGSFTEVPVASMIRADSLSKKETYIKIKFDTLQVIDRLLLTLSGTPYFLRQASLYKKQRTQTRNGEEKFTYVLLDEFEVSSKQPTLLELPPTQTSELLIIVKNQDSPPLSTSSFKAYQLNRYITIWLSASKTYLLKAGDNSMSSPNYDLVFFKDSIPPSPKVLSVGNMVVYSNNPATSTTFFTNRNIIWIAIVIVIVVLGTLSIRLINEASVRK